MIDGAEDTGVDDELDAFLGALLFGTGFATTEEEDDDDVPNIQSRILPSIGTSVCILCKRDT